LEGLAGIIAVALTVFVTRWLLRSDGSELPRTRGDVNVYPVNWRIRLMGICVACVCAAMLVGFRSEYRSGNAWVIAIPACFIVGGILFAFGGEVTTDNSGITKTALFGSHTFRWDEITAVRVYKRQGYIELEAGARKVSVDARFVARQRLLQDILERTKLQPTIE
jgi:hypothetical protein